MEIIKFGVWCICILIIRKAAWGRISRRLQYSLWIAAIIFLLLNSALNISSSFSIENIVFYIEDFAENKTNIAMLPEKDIPEHENDYIQVTEAQAPFHTYNALNPGTAHPPNQQVQNKHSGNSFQHLPKVTPQKLKWGISSLILIYLLFSNVCFYVWCRRNRSFYGRDEKTGLAIYLLQEIKSPFLFGKTVYIDAHMAADSRMREHIIMHEYCHYKHFDHLWVFVRALCFAFHWYNPFLWIAIAYMKRDCELACDEAAIAALDADKRKEYGYTLLQLARKQKGKTSFPTLTTSMNGNFKKLKERIIMISYKKSRSLGITGLVILSMILLAGCTFTKGTGAENAKTEDLAVTGGTEAGEHAEVKNDAQAAPADTVSTNWINDTSGIIYNSVKYYAGYFYYADSENLKRIDQKLMSEEDLAEGNVKLGNCDENYIYYIRYPSDTDGNSGILRLNLNNFAEDLLVSWSDDLWLCSNVYAAGNTIYLEKNNCCEAYEIKGNPAAKLAETENKIYQEMAQCGISQENINAFAAGYTNAAFQYHKFVYLDRNNEKIIVYDTDSGEKLSELERCGSDLLLTEKGFVYKDLEQNIYFRKWESQTSELLYNVGEHQGLTVNYGTYDNQYIYGFYENDEESILVKISWEGECTKDKVFQNINKAVEISFSINNGVRSYLQNGHIIFEAA